MSITSWTAIWGATLSTLLAVSALTRGRPQVFVRAESIRGVQGFPCELQIVVLNHSPTPLVVDRIWLSDSSLRLNPESESLATDVHSAINEVYHRRLFTIIDAQKAHTFTIIWPNRGLPPEKLNERIFGCLFWWRSDGGFLPTLPIVFQIGKKTFQALELSTHSDHWA